MNLRKFAVIATLAVFSTACSSNVKEIPAGYIGRILTPTGWQANMREAGQIDIGKSGTNGTYNTLVLLEATSTTVKEQFADATMEEDKQDHRILTQDGVPIAVDVYIRAQLPEDAKIRNNIFVGVTPENTQDKLVSVITISSIYSRYAQMDVRGKVRAIFARYKDYKDVLQHYDSVNNEIGAMVAKTFQANGVPLQLQNAQLSNVKPDQSLWTAQNQSAAAMAQVDAINKIGEALRRNPEYGDQFKRWESLVEISKNAAAKGHTVFIVTDGSTRGLGNILSAAEAGRR